jgi:hypothetical protein
MPYGYVPPVSNPGTGTIDPSQFTRTGSPYTNPEFLQLYLAQLEQQSFDILFDEEGVNNSVFGSSSVFGASPSSISPAFGGMGEATLPSDIAGLGTSAGATPQYFELIARSALIGKMVDAIDPDTGKQFSGEVKSVSIENGQLIIDVSGTKIAPESLVKVY